MPLTTEVRKPFYAYVGAVDLVVAKTRALPTELAATVSRLVPRSAARYVDLVDRGEKLVGAIRRAPGTTTATAQVASAQSKAKAAATSARKAVRRRAADAAS